MQSRLPIKGTRHPKSTHLYSSAGSILSTGSSGYVSMPSSGSMGSTSYEPSYDIPHYEPSHLLPTVSKSPLVEMTSEYEKQPTSPLVQEQVVVSYNNVYVTIHTTSYCTYYMIYDLQVPATSSGGSSDPPRREELG